MAEEQKNTAITWVQVLTPIILAIIGLILPLSDKCKCNSTVTDSASNKGLQEKHNISNQISTTNSQIEQVGKPSVAPKINPQDSILFIGKVVSIHGSTGIKEANVKIGDKSSKTDQNGDFKIRIPKDVKKILINVDHRMFKSDYIVSSPDESGKVVIRLRPK